MKYIYQNTNITNNEWFYSLKTLLVHYDMCVNY